jgi:GT2 family glycosyltransferase
MLTPVDQSLDLSISIVSYNVRKLLDECLRSIAAHTTGIRYQVIVVDNGSTDGTVEMLRREHPSAQVIANRANIGFAAAQNMGLRAGKGRYLYALDSDTYLKADAFTDMVRFMDSHPEAGAAGARLLSPDGTRQYNRRNFPRSLWPLLYRGTLLKRMLPPSPSVVYYEMSDAVFERPAEVDWLYGGNIILRRQAILDAGCFDERFFIYCEDIDLGYRFQRAGWRRYFVPQAEIYHYGGQGTRQLRFRSYWRHVASFIKLFHKYHWRLDEHYQSSFVQPEGVSRLILVLVNQNKKNLLEDCLQSIYADPPVVPFKAVVVVETSRDGSLEMLKAKFPQALWIANQNPKGYWFAVNQVLHMTESEFLALVPLCPEAVYGQFQKLYHFLEQRPKAGMAGLVAGVGRSFPGSNQKYTEKQLFMENCMMFRRQIIQQTGLPDENSTMEGRELKWCADLRRAGWGLYYLLNL